ncbi:MAG: hypothetical protein IJ131_11585, partial [Eggerthellaceae bacterium]|nr:hypothetical protein [Eggerthellaceae bacterium]
MAGRTNILKSESGASILLAMAIVLVCSMVAAVVLAAAAANVGKNASVEARNRAYYSASCAAQLLADDFATSGLRGEVSREVVTYACKRDHASYVHEDHGVEVEGEKVFTSALFRTAPKPFVQVVEQAAWVVDPNDPNSTFEQQIVVHAPDLYDVYASVKVDNEYNINVELVSTADEGGYSYALTLQIPAVVSEPTISSVTTATDKHMDGWEYYEEAQGLSWKQATQLNQQTGSYEPLENEFGRAVAQSYDVTTTTFTPAITGGAPLRSTGEA